MPLVLDLCDHVYVLNAGALLADGTPRRARRATPRCSAPTSARCVVVTTARGARARGRLRRQPRAARRRPRRRAGHVGRAVRPQRRGQERDDEGDRRAGAGAGGAASSFDGDDVTTLSARGPRRAAAWRTCRRRASCSRELTVEQNLRLGGGGAARNAKPLAAEEVVRVDVYERFPRLARAPPAARRLAVGRRAGDARHRPRPGRRPEAAARSTSRPPAWRRR